MATSTTSLLITGQSKQPSYTLEKVIFGLGALGGCGVIIFQAVHMVQNSPATEENWWTIGEGVALLGISAFGFVRSFQHLSSGSAPLSNVTVQNEENEKLEQIEGQIRQIAAKYLAQEGGPLMQDLEASLCLRTIGGYLQEQNEQLEELEGEYNKVVELNKKLVEINQNYEEQMDEDEEKIKELEKKLSQLRGENGLNSTVLDQMESAIAGLHLRSTSSSRSGSNYNSTQSSPYQVRTRSLTNTPKKTKLTTIPFNLSRTPGK